MSTPWRTKASTAITARFATINQGGFLQHLFQPRLAPRTGSPRQRPRTRRAPIIDVAAKSSRPPIRRAAKFEIGERVFHQKFGYGRIVAVEGNKLLVNFDKAGSKRVMDSFVEKV